MADEPTEFFRVFHTVPRRVQRELGFLSLSQPEQDDVLWGVKRAFGFLYASVLRQIGGPTVSDAASRDRMRLLKDLFCHTFPIGPASRGGMQFVVRLKYLPLLSAFFGVTSGSLRPCIRCGELFSVPWNKNRQRLCDPCRLRAPRISAHGLSLAASQRWRKVRHRMLVRFHSNSQSRKPYGATAKAAYRNWRMWALADLKQRGQRTQKDLKAWESRWAPPVHRGRPRKRAV
jgi:hypothetical protein